MVCWIASSDTDTPDMPASCWPRLTEVRRAERALAPATEAEVEEEAAVGVDVPGVAEAGLVPAVHDQISSLSQFFSFGSLQSRISALSRFFLQARFASVANNSVLGPPRQLDRDDSDLVCLKFHWKQPMRRG